MDSQVCEHMKGWDRVAVFIRDTWVMGSRCKECRQLGHHFAVTPEPLPDSITIQLEGLPGPHREFLEGFLAMADSAPVYDI